MNEQANNICTTCTYSDIMDLPQRGPSLICRAHPPSVIAAPKLNPITHEMELTVINIFPSAPPDGNGCGEYRPEKEIEKQFKKELEKLTKEGG